MMLIVLACRVRASVVFSLVWTSGSLVPSLSRELMVRPGLSTFAGVHGLFCYHSSSLRAYLRDGIHYQRVERRRSWRGKGDVARKMRRSEAHRRAQASARLQDQRAENARGRRDFDLRGADRDTADVAKSYEELLTKVKGYSRMRKLDSSAKERCSAEENAWT